MQRLWKPQVVLPTWSRIRLLFMGFASTSTMGTEGTLPPCHPTCKLDFLQIFFGPTSNAVAGGSFRPASSSYSSTPNGSCRAVCSAPVASIVEAFILPFVRSSMSGALMNSHRIKLGSIALCMALVALSLAQKNMMQLASEGCLLATSRCDNLPTSEKQPSLAISAGPCLALLCATSRSSSFFYSWFTGLARAATLSHVEVHYVR